MNKIKDFFGSIFQRVPIQEKINFARHLSIIIKAGLPVYEGLKIIKKQTASPVLSKIIDQLISDVNNGKFLADSLEKFRRIFGDFFISIIRVGETSGTLSENLIYLSEEMEKSKDLKNKVRSALIYPIVILLATLGIVGLLVFSIFPKVLPIFTSLKVPLPLTTRILIFISSFLLAKGLWLLAVIVILAIVFRIILQKSSSFKLFFHQVLFFIPLLSSLIISFNIANFARVLGLLLKSGIKIVEALNITSQTLDNLVYRRALLKAAEGVRRGEQFTHFLEMNKKIFPPLAAGLIEIGENTGNLEENLAYLSEYYSKEAEILLNNLTTILEPLLLLLMGGLVGFVALSIITPIYQITSAIH